MASLDRVYRTHVTFNPADASHRSAYWRFKTTGRQDENLRFVLEEGFSSVISMMQVRIADHFSRPVEAALGVSQIRKEMK